ncbi:hypothetical protein MNBD_IGNAVI01-168 [hydrothermal vent metagenome]|uniref:Uncharacterized protein n=1 Tax=hydrothermal vent metagenome TaxID=652676 RepID=A0A3B1DCK7_9ZZZZ
MLKIIIAAAFLITLSIHFFLDSASLEPNANWADASELTQQTQLTGYELYFRDGEYFLGLSYAMAAAFTIFALSRFKFDKSKGILGIFSGVTLSAALYAFGCFLIGCCGSPMAVVYAGLFGSSFLGFTKPIVFIITLISIGIGYRLMLKKPEGKVCSTDGCKTC